MEKKLKNSFLDFSLQKPSFHTKCISWAQKKCPTILWHHPQCPPPPWPHTNDPQVIIATHPLPKMKKKWLMNKFFQHLPLQPPIRHTNASHRPTKLSRYPISSLLAPHHSHDPTQLPYKPPRPLICDQKWSKIVYKHVLLTFAFRWSFSAHNPHSPPIKRPKVPFTSTTPNRYPTGYHSHLSVIKNGKKWWKKMFL
jgi:hypothetical protein